VRSAYARKVARRRGAIGYKEHLKSAAGLAIAALWTVVAILRTYLVIRCQRRVTRRMPGMATIVLRSAARRGLGALSIETKTSAKNHAAIFTLSWAGNAAQSAVSSSKTKRIANGTGIQTLATRCPMLASQSKTGQWITTAHYARGRIAHSARGRTKRRPRTWGSRPGVQYTVKTCSAVYLEDL